MRAVDILHKKRHGVELEPTEIAFLVEGFTAGAIPNYQISAFLMAVSLRGMSELETRALTETMLASGSTLDFSDVPGPKIDKHSTGGVGDKTSLIIAPLAACCGVRVPMISGRGLGHSGGTLDKLESIPGFDVRLPRERFHAVVAEVGCSIVGQTDDIAPADRKLYALRDVTATIDSLPLITGSILSKKLAEGISGLVLDVKLGSGAFMKTAEDAEALAKLLIETADAMGTEPVALLTDMNQPLGNNVGNALEVAESIAVLRDEGADDLTELSVTLTAHMLVLGNLAVNVEKGKAKARDALSSGKGLQKFQELVEAQGGDPSVVDDPSRLPRAAERTSASAPASGYVHAIDAELLGRAAMLLGAGRQTVEETIDPAAGLIVHRKIGDAVESGDAIATLHCNHAANREEAASLVTQAYLITDTPPAETKLVHRVMTTERKA